MSAHLRWILPLLGLAGLGVALIWPLGLGGAIPLDPFTPPHLLVLEHLSRVFAGTDTLGQLRSVAAPEGAGVKVVGWPSLLLALALKPLLGSLGALYTAVGLQLGIGAFCLSRGFIRMGASEGAGLAGGLVWLAHPLALTFVANGQFENCIGPGFGLALYGLARGGWAGAFALFLGSLATGFSSPYHCFPLAILVLAGVIFLRPRGGILLGLVAMMGVAPAIFYFGSPGGGLPPMGPGPSNEQIPARLKALLEPVYTDRDGYNWLGMAGQHRVSFEDTVRSRLQGPRPVSAISMESTHTIYLSRSLAAAAGLGLLLGLLRKREGQNGRMQGGLWVMVAGGSLLLAIGRTSVDIGGLHLVSPWSYVLFSRTLHQMGMTYRFVSGVVLALCGLWVLAVDRLPLRWLTATVVSAVILSDGLLMGPFKWPLDGYRPSLAGGYAAVPTQGAVADLPAMTSSPTDAFPPTMALLHGHATSWKPGDGGSLQVSGLMFNQALRGRQVLTVDGVKEGALTLQRMGFRYLAIHSAGLPANSRNILEQALGPPDAEGDGVWGWTLP